MRMWDYSPDLRKSRLRRREVRQQQAVEVTLMHSTVHHLMRYYGRVLLAPPRLQEAVPLNLRLSHIYLIWLAIASLLFMIIVIIWYQLFYGPLCNHYAYATFWWTVGLMLGFHAKQSSGVISHIRYDFPMPCYVTAIKPAVPSCSLNHCVFFYSYWHVMLILQSLYGKCCHHHTICL